MVDGLVAASLGTYLARRGLDESGIGLFITATLLGSATMVTLAGLRPDRLPPRRVVWVTSLLMIVLGAAFALRVPIWLLAVLALVGPLNPGGGDVSAFLPAEQALIAETVAADRRPKVYAWFTLVASAGAAAGGYLTVLPDRLGDRPGWTELRAISLSFWAYAVVGAVLLTIYLTQARSARGTTRPATGRLGPSRRTVRDMTILFALDSAGGGLVLTSLIGVWLNRRFGFDLAQIGFALASMALMSAASSLLASRLVARFGAVHTMVVTHAPAQVLMLLTAFAPNATVAVILLLARSLTSNLDVPARTAFVMSVVTPPERAAAASFTNIPRSLGSALTPAAAGWMLERSSFGWPLIVAALAKLTYDGLLYLRFSSVDRNPAG